MALNLGIFVFHAVYIPPPSAFAALSGKPTTSSPFLRQAAFLL
jgi:hypothetical protein